jgi:hypothetical protein
MLIESKNGETTMLTTSRFADQKASPAGVEMGLSMDLIKIQDFCNKELFDLKPIRFFKTL